MASTKRTVAEETAAALASGKKERLAAIAKTVATSRPKKKANLADLADEMFTVFHGAQGLARRAYLDYLRAPEGSPTRLRFYDITLELAKLAAAGGSKSVEVMSDDEIEDELMDLLTGKQAKDDGDPKTKEGIALAAEMMGAAEADEMTAEECARLDAEIAEMEAGSALDLIAGRLEKADETESDDVE